MIFSMPRDLLPAIDIGAGTVCAATRRGRRSIPIACAVPVSDAPQGQAPSPASVGTPQHYSRGAMLGGVLLGSGHPR